MAVRGSIGEVREEGAVVVPAVVAASRVGDGDSGGGGAEDRFAG